MEICKFPYLPVIRKCILIDEFSINATYINATGKTKLSKIKEIDKNEGGICIDKGN